MIIKRNRLWFKTVTIILEDDTVFIPIIDSKIYDCITILSYNRLDIEGFTLVEKNTALINITDVEDAFTSFSDTTRNEIRRTDKIPSLVFINDDKDYEKIFNIYKKFEYSQHRVPIGFLEFKSFKFFTAYYNSDLISCISIIHNNKFIRIRSIFSKRMSIADKELYKIIGYSSKRIMFEICKWGNSNGATSLDLASVNLTDQSKKGITGFKSSFGGENMSEYTYIYKGFWFSVFEKFVVIRNTIKKIFHV